MGMGTGGTESLGRPSPAVPLVLGAPRPHSEVLAEVPPRGGEQAVNAPGPPPACRGSF